MTICYVDESGTDANLPIAVVAGLLLDPKAAFWLDVEWEKILGSYGLSALHMREFRAADLVSGTPEQLFTDVTRAINTHKLMSVTAVLDSDQYRRCFSGVTKLSMYGACFCNLATFIGVGLDIYGPHRWPLSFVLDDGNPYRQDISDGKPVFLRNFPRLAGIDFSSDTGVRTLQAADVLSWAVRRELSGGAFPKGLEPLKTLFDEQHKNVNYEDEWMKGVAQNVLKSAATSGAT